MTLGTPKHPKNGTFFEPYFPKNDDFRLGIRGPLEKKCIFWYPKSGTPFWTISGIQTPGPPKSGPPKIWTPRFLRWTSFNSPHPPYPDIPQKHPLFAHTLKMHVFAKSLANAHQILMVPLQNTPIFSILP